MSGIAERWMGGTRACQAGTGRDATGDVPARLRQPAWLHAAHRRRQVGIVAGLFVCAWAFDAAFAVRHGFFDLRVYYGAINYWVRRTGEIYDYLLPRTKYGFTYPPFAALVMLPMAYVGWHVAIVISVCSPSSPRSRCCTGWSSRSPAGTAGRRGSSSAIACGPGGRVRAAARDVPVRPGQHDAAVPGRRRPAAAGALQPQRRRRRHRPGHRDQADARASSSSTCSSRGGTGPRRWPAAPTWRPRCSPARSRPTRRGSSGPTRCGTPAGSVDRRSSPTSRSTASSPGWTRQQPDDAAVGRAGAGRAGRLGVAVAAGGRGAATRRPASR